MIVNYIASEFIDGDERRDPGSSFDAASGNKFVMPSVVEKREWFA
jgi:hypothetical protein